MRRDAIHPIARTLARELTVTAFLMLGVSFVVFVILYFSPGDSFSLLLGGQMPDAQTETGIREALGIPQTWYGQYLSWLLH